MLSPKQPLDDSVNRVFDEEEHIPLKTKSHENPPFRSVSIKAKDSQIQIVRRNIGEEPVFHEIYKSTLNFFFFIR